MNRSERLQEVMRLEGLAAAAKAMAAEHRTELSVEAAAEFEREGTAPTWRLADLGTITLPVSKETPFVHNPNALVEWCTQRYPSEVETIVQLRPAFQAALLQRLLIAGDAVVDPSTGEVVPGVGVRPGGIPKALTIRPTPEATAVFAAVGRKLLEDLLTPGGAE